MSEPHPDHPIAEYQEKAELLRRERAFSQETAIICPTCGTDISTEKPLWVLLNRWYCSERCVRKVRAMGLE